MTRTILPITIWPQVSAEVKAHALSLVIGRYYGTPALLSRWRLEDWLCFLAVVIETETQKLVESYGELLPDLPAMHEGPSLASTMIKCWKTKPALREKFPTFMDYVESVERAIEQGIPIVDSDS